ncbi:MAG: class I SAM-dependent methyltransferase [Calothrix sp. MO_167.B42]|nr:class I SAM-dependent methyltransferase [Calothrix sp. MO_167.B42]
MKNKNLWTETKFVKTERGYQPSTNPEYVGYGSLFIASMQSQVYEKIINQHARGILLDLGCGNVPLYDMYKDKVIDNICVDWGNSLHKNSYLDYEFDLNAEIPLKSEQFDTILITDVLEHIANPNKLMSEVARLLKPSGKIILTVPFLYWLHEQPYDYFRYTAFALNMFCQTNNLTVVELEPYGGAPEVILDIIAKHISFLQKKSAFASQIHLFLSRTLMSSSFVQKLSSKTAKIFPLGYYLIASKPE